MITFENVTSMLVEQFAWYENFAKRLSVCVCTIKKKSKVKVKSIVKLHVLIYFQLNKTVSIH